MKTEQRVFIIGNLYGHYEKLISFLYNENFNKNDILISTGFLVDFDNLSSLNAISFFIENHGLIIPDKPEKHILAIYENGSPEQLPLWLRNHPSDEIYLYLKSSTSNIVINDEFILFNDELKEIKTSIKGKKFITNLKNYPTLMDKVYTIYSVYSDPSEDAPLNCIMLNFSDKERLIIKTQSSNLKNAGVRDFITDKIINPAKNFYNTHIKKQPTQQVEEPAPIEEVTPAEPTPIEEPDDTTYIESEEPVMEDIEIEAPEPIAQEPTEEAPIQYEDWSSMETVENQMERELAPEVKDTPVYHYKSSLPVEYPGDFSAGMTTGIDISYGVLSYFKALGYTTVKFNLGEKHNKYDICDEYNGHYFLIDDILQNAINVKSQSGHPHPPAPLFSLTHPDCECNLSLVKPASLDDIPDNAPGLPMNLPPDDLQHYKNILFNHLPNNYNIDSYTSMPSMRVAEAFIRYTIFNNRKATENSFEDIIAPAIVKNDSIINLPFGLQHPMTKGDKGFILGKSGQEIEFYSWKYNAIYKIPKSLVYTVPLSSADTSEPESGLFVTIDGEEGIIYKVLKDKVQVFLPSLKSFIYTDMYELMDYQI